VDAPPARLRLRVAPGARRSEIVGRLGDAWRVRVAAAPERGRANAALVDLLADTLGLRRPQVRVVAGAGSRDKVVVLAGLAQADAEALLERAAGPA
jgi:uncharacterized protein (TIGR00251 family)